MLSPEIDAFLKATRRDLAALKQKLEAIEKTLGEFRDVARSTLERQQEISKEEIRVLVRSPEATERQRATDHRKNLFAQRAIAAGTWAAFLAASVYAGIAAHQLSEMKKSTTAATAAVLAAQQANSDARDRFEEDERPYIWFNATGTGAPEFIQTPNSSPSTGQVVWSWHYTDYGRTPAYGVQWVFEEIKIGNRPFKVMLQRPYGHIGSVTPPGKDDFATIPSKPGLTQEEFNHLLQVDHAISIRAHVDYVDAEGAVYETGFCMSRLSGGAIEYCDEGNYIKELSKPPVTSSK